MEPGAASPETPFGKFEGEKRCSPAGTSGRNLLSVKRSCSPSAKIYRVDSVTKGDPITSHWPLIETASGTKCSVVVAQIVQIHPVVCTFALNFGRPKCSIASYAISRPPLQLRHGRALGSAHQYIRAGLWVQS